LKEDSTCTGGLKTITIKQFISFYQRRFNAFGGFASTFNAYPPASYIPFGSTTSDSLTYDYDGNFIFNKFAPIPVFKVKLVKNSTGATCTFEVIDSASGSNYIFNTGNFQINNIKYIFPNSQGGASTTLTNDGSGNLSWGAGGSGTVTSIATGFGLIGGTITSTGTLKADTSRQIKSGVLTWWGLDSVLSSYPTGSGATNQVAYFNATHVLTSSANNSFADGKYLEINSTSNTGQHGIINIQSSTNTAPAKSFWIKERGTLQSPTNAANGDSGFYLSFHAYNGAIEPTAHILGYVKKISSSNAVAGDIEFATSSILGGKILAITIDTGQNLILAHPLTGNYGGTGVNNSTRTITTTLNNVTIPFDSVLSKYGTIECGSASEPTFFSTAPGSDGYVWTSNGTAAYPTWQSVSGDSGCARGWGIIVSAAKPRVISVDTTTGHTNGARLATENWVFENSLIGLTQSSSPYVTALGYGYHTGTGIRTINIGYGSGGASMTGADNTSIGYNANASMTSGSQNFAEGYQSNYSDLTGNQNVAIGYEALFGNTVTGNVAIGFEAMACFAGNTGAYNFGLGYEALYANTSGAANVAIGYEGLLANTSGADNIAIGNGAVVSNVTGTYNIGIGAGALTDETGSFNSVIGGNGFYYTTGSHNTGNGYEVGYLNTTGWGNTYTGYQAGYPCATTSSRNVILGDSSGLSCTAVVTQNTFVGYKSNGTASAVNEGAFGYLATATENNSIMIGNSSIVAVQIGAGTSGAYCDPIQVSAATSGTVVSNGAETLELTGGGGTGSVTITEPSSPTSGQHWRISTSQSLVTIASTNSSNFYGSGGAGFPLSVTYTQSHEFEFDGTKWLTLY
jgi:hypothetical protein